MLNKYTVVFLGWEMATSLFIIEIAFKDGAASSAIQFLFFHTCLAYVKSRWDKKYIQGIKYINTLINVKVRSCRYLVRSFGYLNLQLIQHGF